MVQGHCCVLIESAHVHSNEGSMSQTSIGTTSRHWPARMRRRQASAYLLEVHGISLSHNTLAKIACISSEGPRFYLDGRFPLYDQVELDAFAMRRLGRLRNSTTDAAGEQIAA
jgi:hypothetical protein